MLFEKILSIRSDFSDQVGRKKACTELVEVYRELEGKHLDTNLFILHKFTRYDTFQLEINQTVLLSLNFFGKFTKAPNS